MNKKEKIKNLFDQLTELHQIYLTVSEQKKEIVHIKCEPIFIELEKIGVSRVTAETYLLYGDDFFLYEYGMPWKLLKTTS